MKCPKCQFDNLEGAKFCNECGNKLELVCPECGKVNPLGSKFCNECGYDLRKPKSTKINLPDNLKGRSIYDKVIPTVCNLNNMLVKLKELHGNDSLLKPWEKRSYNAYRVDTVKIKILNSHKEKWKEIIRNHILQGDPSDFGASCIDIYLVAYVAETFGAGRKRFFQYVKEKGISQKENAAQAIWQVGKGDGVFLDILNNDGTIKDVEFIKSWING